MAPEFVVPGTNIKIKDDDPTRGNLLAQLMSRVDGNEGLTGPNAQKLALKLISQRVDSELVKIAQEKKDFSHPAEAAKWLLKGQNKFLAIVWRNDEKGIVPPRDHTV